MKKNRYLTEEDVVKLVESKNMQFISPKGDYRNQTQRVEIKCICGTPFFTTIKSFRNVQYPGCEDCKIKKWGQGIKFSLERVIKAINSSEGNGATFVGCDEYKNTSSSIEIKCKCGEVFETTFQNFRHSNKGRCRECIVRHVGEAVRKRQIIPYHTVKEGLSLLGYRLVTTEERYSGYIVEYLCKCGSGEIIEQTYTHFKAGVGRVCKVCTKQFDGLSRRTYSDIKKEVENHSSCKIVTPEKDYKNTHQIITFKCYCGDMFDTSVHEFKSNNKRQCNKCGLNLMTKEELYRIFDSDLGNGCTLISYVDTNGYILTDSVLNIECSCGREFATSRYSFTHHHINRCRVCSKNISNGELRIKSLLKESDVNYEMEFSIKDCRGDKQALPFDFAVFDGTKQLKFLIEYDGEQHFRPVNFGGCTDEVAMKNHKSTLKNDNTKTLYCIKNNIPLLRIPYWEFEEIEHIVFDKLIKHSLIKPLN